MDQLAPNILTILIFLPIIGALVVSVLPRPIAKPGALGISILTFALSLVLWLNWPMNASILATSGSAATPAFEQNIPWLQQYGYGIRYHLGIDGMSMLMILLTTFLTPLVILAAWTDVKERTKEFVICLLLLEGAIIGVFSALDIILFYIFWEAVLIPMYLLIGIWGGPRRIYASIKFFLYTMAGSVLMWIAMLYVYFQQTGERSFDYDAFRQAANVIDSSSPAIALWLFAAFAFAFAIKVPLFPVHTWLPDAHTEAPTAGSVMLAAVLLKMGTYGFIRFAIPFFPNAAQVAAPLMVILAIIGIIYGALVAMMQTDVKRLVAYSSVSHLGFVVLGIFAALMVADPDTAMIAMSGATLQMINHGISTGALFLLVGVIYERRHTREISQFGGLSSVMPRYTVLFWVALFASIGLPGLNGFIGEYLILQGTIAANFWYAFFAATGVILGAVYMLRMFRSMMYGEITCEENRHLRDVNPRETFVLVAVLAIALWIGVAPQPFLDIINPGSRNVTTLVRSQVEMTPRITSANQTQLNLK